MDKNKLLQIIKKDTHELYEMTEDLIKSDTLSVHEIEFALSKSRIVLQEFELLKGINNDEKTAEVKQEEKSPISTGKEEAQNPESLKDEPSKENTTLKEIEEFEIEDDDDEEIIVVEKTPEKTSERLNPKSDILEYTKHEQEIAETKQEQNIPTSKEKIQKKLIGDADSQQKSLNDILTASGKLEHKLASTPISKLQTAIGLNDRFQYTRELFQNNPELFKKTIIELDEMGSFIDAVNYLDNHFQWEKNDTSIKFAQLIKRRFSN